MEVTLRIDKKGIKKGTLGWLVDNIDHIVIGDTKVNKHQGAWLKDKDNNTLTVLAIRGFYDDSNKIDRIVQATGSCWQDELSCDFTCSDACWRAIEKIIDIAVEKMEEEYNKEFPINFNIITNGG